MYRKILLALDHTASDELLLPEISALAKLMNSDLLVLHVADGWVARNFEQLNLAASDEMKSDWGYIEEIAKRLRDQTGLKVETRLALGDPPKQILEVADESKCDLIAMTSHGHRLVGDIFHGSTIEEVRHKARVPMIIIPAARRGSSTPQI
jgi:manganese transport protein